MPVWPHYSREQVLRAQQRKEPHDYLGTFVGARAPQGVTLVRADAASYCIQVVQGALVQHEQGPGGAVQPGPC